MVANEGIMTEERVMVNRDEADSGFVTGRRGCGLNLVDERKRFKQLYSNIDRALEWWLAALRRDLERTRRLNQWLREGRR